MNNQIFNEKFVSTDIRPPQLHVTDKTEILFVSDSDTTSYHVIIKDTFRHNKDIEITSQVILHSIQTLVDETKNYLIKNNIRDVSPIVYLLNIHQANKIKEICASTDLKEDVLISAFLKNTFEINFSSLLKEVLINLCLTDKVSYEKIIAFLDSEDQENLKQLLDVK
jgi:hypothetical protein